MAIRQNTKLFFIRLALMTMKGKNYMQMADWPKAQCYCHS